MRISVCLTLLLVVELGALPAIAAGHVQSTAGKASSAVGAKKPVRKTTSHAVKHGRYRYSTYFVPPPPVYMPNVLPELSENYYDDEPQPAVKKPENPYKKYIYTRDGSTPAPVQTRKGVVTWHNRG